MIKVKNLKYDPNHEDNGVRGYSDKQEIEMEKDKAERIMSYELKHFGRAVTIDTAPEKKQVKDDKITIK